MPVSNMTADMKIERDENGVLWVSNRPVGLKFKRACGVVIDYAQREEVCMCEKCRSK